MSDDTERVAVALGMEDFRDTDNLAYSIYGVRTWLHNFTRALHASGADIEAFCREMEKEG